MKSITHITHATKTALLASIGTTIVFAMVYMMVEPQITHSQSAEFTIQATVTGESSFLVPPSDVTMDGTLNGITGGQATGSTQFVVQSNSTGGYEVQISFENNGTANAMLGDVTADESLRDYGGDVTGQPSKGYTASGSAQFAYTVTSSTTSDTDQSFFHDGGANCNTGSDQTETCWKAPDTANFTIVDRNSAAPAGATSTVTFNVTIPNAVSPVPAAETYTATATLSLINT